MTRTITGFLFVVIALLLSPSVSAQVKYQPEMDDFLGEWIHPREYKKGECSILISKRGGSVYIRVKFRKSYFQIEQGYDDTYRYHDFDTITFNNNKFILYKAPAEHDDVEITFKIFFNNGQLEVWYESGDFREKYIMYPNESNF